LKLYFSKYLEGYAILGDRIKQWKNILWSPNELEYQQRLQKFEQACVGCNMFIDYVKETWLTPH